MKEDIGRILIISGLGIAGLGLFLKLGGKFNFLGKMPGDIFIERDNFSFFFPLGTCLLISALLSLAFWLFRR